MRIVKRIFLIWALFLPLGFLDPRPEFDFSPLFNFAVRMLVGIVSFYLFRLENDRGAKAIFFNFFLFFGLLSVASLLPPFVVHGLSRMSPYGTYYHYICTNGAYFLLLASCMAFILADSLFRDLSIYRRYLLVLFLIGGVAGYLYYPYIENPKYLYTTPDIKDFKAVDNILESFRKEGKEHPTVPMIASRVHLYVREGATIVDELSGLRKEQRIAVILPYTEGDNYIPLLLRPLYRNSIFLSVLSIVFIVLYLGYNYFYDPPNRAFLEKIVLLFLLYCVLEALHYYAFSKSVTWLALKHVASLGQYVSVALTLVLLWFFSLRLKFVISPEGKFYERYLVIDSRQITRWRDGIDNWVVRKFLNPEILERRFIVRRREGI